MLKFRKDFNLKELKNYGFVVNDENNGYEYRKEDFTIFVYKTDNDVYKGRVLYIESEYATIIDDIDIIIDLLMCGIILLEKS